MKRLCIALVYCAAQVLACSGDDNTRPPDSSNDAGADVPTDHVSTNDVKVDAPACAPPNVLQYTTPGCGAQATPTCGSPTQDACAIPVCSCNGATIVRCDFASEPFAYSGPCTDGGGDAEAGPRHVEGGDSSDAPNESNTVDAHSDNCAPPNVLRYMTAGCGAQAMPVCGSALQDACAIPVCGCNGVTIPSCDYSAEPFAHTGPCPDGGDSGQDAPSEASPGDGASSG